ncbi:sucrose phosphorylase [Clostridium oryzae]|uniref:Sucrose phosphorylase n=1 Tax=Clostridium oryzae TaxID=1450648 RepID=A0A1V4IR88_9CLOT|nr:sucrose phosphorylase [Clostridium oryzae]OPJ62538.1 sucrose phosphorylase [Clostridium oryzae]
MALKNKVQLITYPDSLGGDLKSLNNVLNKYFADVFEGGVHILPPFPSSGDRGFAPLTYMKINDEFGTWDDVKSIGEKFDVVLDVMVNHISRQSEYFQDFLQKGRQSKYADLFITLDKYWENGEPKQEDIDKMFLRRKKPYSTFEIAGKQEKVWTTFGKSEASEQIDLDVKSKIFKELFSDFFKKFSENNVKIVRLDAVGYVIKKLGTSCFFVEPDIYEFMNWIKDIANSYGIELLPEVHAYYEIQYRLAEHGFWIYDFILPYTVLEALSNKSSKSIKKYLSNRPKNQFTTLDCHDGVPVKPDVDGLIDTSVARKIVNESVERGANLSRILSEEHKDKDGFDVHQINGTYYSLLNKDDDAYIASRAIQFFTPGIPQVYYVGALAGENDDEMLKATGDGRGNNRHNYTLDEIEEAVNTQVVQRLLKLMRFRNKYEAFDGDFKVMDSNDNELKLFWQKEDKCCQLNVNLITNKSIIEYIDENGKKINYSL